jgi:hypothetical protein
MKEKIKTVEPEATIADLYGNMINRLKNEIELLKEDLECVHMFLDDFNVPRKDENGEEYSIVGRIKHQTYDDEVLFEKIVPYGREQLITMPLWEEGDFRPMLNIWQIPKGETVIECLESYKKIKNLCESFFRDEEYNFEVDDDLSFEQRMLPYNMKNTFTIKIYQSGDILDDDIVPNYSIVELLKIGSDLLSYIEDNTNKTDS